MMVSCTVKGPVYHEQLKCQLSSTAKPDEMNVVLVGAHRWAQACPVPILDLWDLLMPASAGWVLSGVRNANVL